MSETLSRDAVARPAPLMTGRAKAALILLSGALFLEGIDVAMLNIALPAIRADLGLSTRVLSAVVSAYVLGYAGFMLLGGRAADLFGRRKMFLLSLAAFIAFSGLGGLATEGWVLLLSRFATGVAAAFMTPAGLSLVTTNFREGPQRNKAVLIYSATGSAGFSLGLVVGGLLAAISWRWVFFAAVILSSVIFLLSLRIIVDNGERDKGKRFDLPGAVTLTAAMLLAIYAVMRLDRPAEGWEITIAVAGTSAVLWLLFVAIERRAETPLMRFGILRSGTLVRVNLAALLFAGAFFGFQFIASLYLQELLGWTPLQTSLALLAIGIDLFIAPTVTPWLVERFGNMRVILGGLLLAAASYALFLRLDFDWTYAAMVPTMVLLGLSFAFAYGPITIAATEGVAEREQGLASGLVNTSFQFGAALGLSATSAVSVLGLGTGATPEAALEGMRLALAIPLAAIVVAAALIATDLRQCPADAECAV